MLQADLHVYMYMYVHIHIYIADVDCMILYMCMHNDIKWLPLPWLSGTMHVMSLNQYPVWNQYTYGRSMFLI